MKNVLIIATIFLLVVIPRYQSVIVTGQSHDTFIINKVKTTLTFAEVVAAAAGDTLIMTDKQNQAYKIGPTWTLFSLPEAKKYWIREYMIEGKCSCHMRKCGDDCPGKELEDCFQNNPASGTGSLALCTLEQGFSFVTPPGNNYCWTYKPTKEQEYTSRSLNHLATISLTTWPGAANKEVNPGYTLKEDYEGIDYSLTGTIIKRFPRNHIDTSMYRYADSEQRLVFLDDVLTLSEKPRPKDFDVNLTICGPGGFPYFMGAKYNGPKLSDSANRAQFTLFTVIHNATKPKLSSLKGINILAPDGGTTEWVEATFDFVDPCNQQFLTLKKDQMGNVFVNVPPSQTLTYVDIICIAVKEDSSDSQYKLVLYELKLGSSDWIASTRFIGGLSNDYLEEIQIRITTKSDLTLSLKEGTASLQLIDSEPPVLRLVTSVGMSCQIALSPNCSFPLATTDDIPYNQKAVSDCGFWYQGVFYVCDGIFGTYHPPAKYTNAPLDVLFVPANKTMENVMPNTGSYYNSGSSSSTDGFENKSFWEQLFDLIWNYTPQKMKIFLRPIVNLLIKAVIWFLIGVFCFLAGPPILQFFCSACFSVIGSVLGGCCSCTKSAITRLFTKKKEHANHVEMTKTNANPGEDDQQGLMNKTVSQT